MTAGDGSHPGRDGGDVGEPTSQPLAELAHVAIDGVERGEAAGLEGLCGVVGRLAGQGHVRRWAVGDAACVEAARGGPLDEGRYGRVYRLGDGAGRTLALKLYKRRRRGAEGGDRDGRDGAGSGGRGAAGLAEMFHLLRCRDVEQVRRA